MGKWRKEKCQSGATKQRRRTQHKEECINRKGSKYQCRWGRQGPVGKWTEEECQSGATKPHRQTLKTLLNLPAIGPRLVMADDKQLMSQRRGQSREREKRSE